MNRVGVAEGIPSPDRTCWSAPDACAIARRVPGARRCSRIPQTERCMSCSVKASETAVGGGTAARRRTSNSFFIAATSVRRRRTETWGESSRPRRLYSSTRVGQTYAAPRRAERDGRRSEGNSRETLKEEKREEKEPAVLEELGNRRETVDTIKPEGRERERRECNAIEDRRKSRRSLLAVSPRR